MQILSKATAAVIKQLREEAGITLVELARRSGLDAGNLSRIEGGKSYPSFETMKKLSIGFNIPLTLLLSKCEVPGLDPETRDPVEPLPFKYDEREVSHIPLLFRVNRDAPEAKLLKNDLLLADADTLPRNGDVVLTREANVVRPFVYRLSGLDRVRSEKPLPKGFFATVFGVYRQVQR